MSSDDQPLVEGRKSNPNIRPDEQNKTRSPGDFAATPPNPRAFKTGFSPDFLKAYHAGVMRYTYRGIGCLKSPIDLAIYMMVIW
ncbi:MAG: hypothetical protein AAFQ11_05340, partial [Pseudomonadota bacterium]